MKSARFHVDMESFLRMVGREGFEPPKAKPADLQSAAFDRSATYPVVGDDYILTVIFFQKFPPVFRSLLLSKFHLSSILSRPVGIKFWLF